MKKDNKTPPKMPKLNKTECLNTGPDVWNKTHKSKNKYYFIAASISSLFLGTIVISSLQKKAKVSFETLKNNNQKTIEVQSKIKTLKRSPANINSSTSQDKNNYKHENQFSPDEKLEKEYVKQVSKIRDFKSKESYDHEEQNIEEVQEDIIEYQEQYEQIHVKDVSYLDEEYAKSFNSNQED